MKKTVGAIIEDNGKILLMKRNHKPFNNYWGLPGGHIDQGETAEQAVIREVKEETGLDFEPKFLKEDEEDFEEEVWHASASFFAGKKKGNVKLSKEHTAFDWFTQDQIKEMQLGFNHKKIIKDYWRN